jgi:hypothetical protein
MASTKGKRLDAIALAWRRCPTHPSTTLECNGGARWTGTDAEWAELETRFLRPLRHLTERVERHATRGWCACGRRFICRTCWREAAERVTVPDDLSMTVEGLARFHELMDKIVTGACRGTT